MNGEQNVIGGFGGFRKTDREGDIQNDRETERHIDSQTDRQTDRHRSTE